MVIMCTTYCNISKLCTLPTVCVYIYIYIYTHKGRLISNAHSEIFCQRSKVAMRAQCVLVATTLLHTGAKFHSFLYTGSKTVCVNMKSCYGGMSTRLKQRAVTEEGDQFLFNIVTGVESWIHHFDPEEKRLSIQYRHTSSPCPKNSKQCRLLARFFWLFFGTHKEFTWQNFWKLGILSIQLGTLKQ